MTFVVSCDASAFLATCHCNFLNVWDWRRQITRLQRPQRSMALNLKGCAKISREHMRGSVQGQRIKPWLPIFTFCTTFELPLVDFRSGTRQWSSWTPCSLTYRTSTWREPVRTVASWWTSGRPAVGYNSATRTFPNVVAHPWQVFFCT